MVAEEVLTCKVKNTMITVVVRCQMYVWKHFTKTSDKKNAVYCIYQKELAYLGSTRNLHEYLSTKHKLQYFSFSKTATKTTTTLNGFLNITKLMQRAWQTEWVRCLYKNLLSYLEKGYTLSSQK